MSTTTALAYNASAGTVQAALEALAGIGNVAVTRNDDIYVIRFQGSLSDTRVAALVAHAGNLRLAVEQLGGAVVTGAGTATISVRPAGLS